MPVVLYVAAIAESSLAENCADFGEDFGEGDGGEAFFFLFDTGFQTTAPAIDLVVEDAVLAAVGEPDAGLVAGGEDGDTGGLDGGGEVHGAAVVADEEAGVGEGCGAFAGGEAAAEVDDGTGEGGVAPTGGGELTGFALFGCSAEGEGVAGIEGGEVGEERSPVVAAPVFGLDFGTYADGDERAAGGGGEGLRGGGVFGGGEGEVPTGGGVEVGLTEFSDVAGESLGFGFQGLLVLLPAVVLHVFCEWNADEPGDATEAEEGGISARRLNAAGCAEIDEDLGPPACDLPPEGEEFGWAAGTYGVGDVLMDEAGVLQDGSGGWGFDIDGEVGEQTALGVREGAGDEMEGGECDQGIAQTAEPIDQNPFDRGGHVCTLVCLVWRLWANWVGHLIEFGCWESRTQQG